MAGKFADKGLDYDACVSECQAALLRAAELFDASRGFRFSTYACNAMMRACQRLFRVPRHLHLASNADCSPSVAAEVFMGLDSRQLMDAIGLLAEDEADIIKRRFGIGRDRQRLDEVGRDYGVGKERIRQRQVVILARLRVLLKRELD